MSEKKSQVDFFDLIRKLTKKDYRILANMIKSRDHLNDEITEQIKKLGTKHDAMEQSKREEERKERKDPSKRAH